MKKLILIFVALLVIAGLGYGSYRILSGPDICKTHQPLFMGFRPAIIDKLCPPAIRSGEDIKNAKVAVLCYLKKNTCDYFKPQKDSGNLKLTITINGMLGKRIEVSLWTTQRPPDSDQVYIKYTDDNGVALFQGMASGIYYPQFDLKESPKEYGNAYLTWDTKAVEVVKDTTRKLIINLTKKQ